MPGQGAINRRRARLLEALRGRWLHEMYAFDPEVRDLLEREARRYRKRPADALLTPEMLDQVARLSQEYLDAESLPISPGQPPSAAYPIASLSTQVRLDFTEREPVIIVPGNLASLLYDIGSKDSPPELRRLLWFNWLALRGKGILKLQLGHYDGSEVDATPGVRVVPGGTFPGLFDPLEAALILSGFAVLPRPYDWRKDIDHETVARGLMSFIRQVYALYKQPVHLVAHSLGGLVARRAVDLLRGSVGEDQAREMMGCMVLLAPAVSGTFTGALGLVAAIRQMPLGQLMPQPSKYSPLATRTWTALYQLLPWDDDLFPSLKYGDHNVRSAGFWGNWIDPDRLSRAFPAGGSPWASEVDTQFLAKKTTVILGQVSGNHCETAGGVRWQGNALVRDPKYDVNGDGFMAHRASILKDTDAYLADGVNHNRMPMAPRVIRAVIDILHNGSPSNLPHYP